MSKKQFYVSKAEVLANNCASKLNLEIVDVDYVKEHGMNILRILATDSEGLTLEQATDLNNAISDALDVEDFIDDEYYLEVSSPGIERELKKDADIKNAVGQYICIKTYEKILDQKEWNGDLLSYEEDIIKMQINIKGRKKIIEVPKSKISKIRLAIKF